MSKPFKHDGGGERFCKPAEPPPEVPACRACALRICSEHQPPLAPDEEPFIPEEVFVVFTYTERPMKVFLDLYGAQNCAGRTGTSGRYTVRYVRAK